MAVVSVVGRTTDLSPGVAQAVNASRQVISAGARVLLGFQVAEAAGGTAKVRFHDGTSAAGPVRGTVTLIANESVREWFADEAIELDSGGIYLEVVSGSVEGVVHWGLGCRAPAAFL